MKVFQHVSDIGDLKVAMQEAFEIKEDRFKFQTLGKNKTVLLIFFNMLNAISYAFERSSAKMQSHNVTVCKDSFSRSKV